MRFSVSQSERGTGYVRGTGRTAGNTRPTQMRKASSQNRRPDDYPRRPGSRNNSNQPSRYPSQPRRSTASDGSPRYSAARQNRPNDRGYRPAQRPGRPPRRGGIRPGAIIVTLIVALLSIALIVGGIRLIRGKVAASEPRFVDNVSINDVALSGYTKEEGAQKMEEMRQQWMNAVYTLSYDGRTWSFSPANFNAKMDFDDELERAWNLGHVGSRASIKQTLRSLEQMPAEFTSEVSYDEAELDAYIDAIAAEIDVDPVDAEVTLTEEKPVITRASQNGAALNKSETKKRLTQLITTGEGDTELPVKVVKPSITSESMEMKVVAKFSTDVSFRGYDSRYNVRLALNYFNCFTVGPGDTVSFNDVVGPRTEEAGFRKAPEYAGNEIVSNVGGGVCQASTTLYDACIMSGLTVIERHQHNMTVTYVKPSQDAAVEYGDKDFVFRNDTPYTYYFYTNVSGETADITVYGTRPEYHYVLESVVKDERPTDRERFEDDVDGKYCYYVDQTKLKTEGHGSCHSEGWIVSYDWNTKEEVSREQISYDSYSPGVTVYWRGVHSR